MKRQWSLPQQSSHESYQAAVERLCKERNYTRDPTTLALILCEEVGEVAHDVLNLNPSYKPKSGRTQGDIEHELFDVLSCLCALASAVDVDLGI